MNAVHSKSPKAILSSARLVWLLVGAGMVAMFGCGRETQIQTEYGKRNGVSINGTGVLSQMFRQAGHRVSGWKRLSPKLQNDDVIVWFPASEELPSTDAIVYLSDWLSQGNRTLIYVPGQYDASMYYWQTLYKNATAEQKIETRRRLAKMKGQQILYNRQSGDRTCDWFKLKRTDSDFGDLSGSWTDGVDTNSVEIESLFQIELDEPSGMGTSESLLSSGSEDFAISFQRPHWHNSQVIVVSNSSILSNLKLVNHEHRKIAAHLVNECPPNSRVTFLESGPFGIPISESDTSMPIMFRAFTRWPMNFLILHMTVLGILFCLSVFPIFGRARNLPAKSTADFGKHVTAVGEMLHATKDGKDYVRRVLTHYRESHKDAHK